MAGWNDYADACRDPGLEVFDDGTRTYTPPGSSTAYTVRMVYDAEFVVIERASEGGVDFETTKPVVHLKLSEFVAKTGVQPAQGGTIYVGSLWYEVRSVQPDGSGGVTLILEQRG
jgi:hypothetical protein